MPPKEQCTHKQNANTTNKIKRKQENKIVASYVVEHLPKFDPHISKKQRKQTKHKQRWTKARPKKET